MDFMNWLGDHMWPVLIIICVLAIFLPILMINISPTNDIQDVVFVGYSDTGKCIFQSFWTGEKWSLISDCKLEPMVRYDIVYNKNTMMIERIQYYMPHRSSAGGV